jgi:hypothetical protein
MHFLIGRELCFQKWLRKPYKFRVCGGDPADMFTATTTGEPPAGGVRTQATTSRLSLSIMRIPPSCTAGFDRRRAIRRLFQLSRELGSAKDSLRRRRESRIGSGTRRNAGGTSLSLQSLSEEDTGADEVICKSNNEIPELLRALKNWPGTRTTDRSACAPVWDAHNGPFGLCARFLN